MPEAEIEFGYCHCGCGQKTTINKQNSRRYGHVKGQPSKYVKGHNAKLPPLTLEAIMRMCVVDSVTGCWLWAGYKTPFGYGQIRRGGKAYLLHRLTYTMSNGEIPEGILICHKCDTPGCCNPSHLFEGTHQDNSDDMKAKGRSKKGEQLRSSVLTEEDVRTILSSSETSKQLSAHFPTSARNIRRIRQGTRWQHVVPSETPNT